MRRSRPANLLRLLPALAAVACAASDDPIAERREIEPTPQLFESCYNYNCAERARIRLAAAQWGEVRALFEPAPADAADERRRIAQAVALLERMVGEQAATFGDVGGTFQGFGRPGQLDCVDETFNTTTYLVMLQRDGLLTWHTLRGPALRGYFILGWPHTTATIVETATEAAFAVDSWFHDNGVPPAIVPLKLWSTGWSPEDT